VLAIIAPGQGSQTPGMLSPWIEDPAQRELLSTWSESIGLDLIHLGTTADADEIKDTANAQPLIVAAGLLSAHALNLSGKFSYVAGHSVGEITAASIAGSLSALDAMKLVRARGIESGGQIVAAGSLDALAQLAPEGARVRSLAVAGAFHTSYMQPAVEPLRALAQSLSPTEPTVPVISNRDGEEVSEGREILNRIVNQIANPVRWDLCMERLASLGVTGVIEVAPAGTLVGLIKRAVPTIEQFALKSPADIDAAREFAAAHGGI